MSVQMFQGESLLKPFKLQTVSGVNFGWLQLTAAVGVEIITRKKGILCRLRDWFFASLT